MFVPHETKYDSANDTDNNADQENTERRDKAHSVLLLYIGSQLQNDPLVMSMRIPSVMLPPN